MEQCGSDAKFLSGDLGIIALRSCEGLGRKINNHLLDLRHKAGIPAPDTFLVNVDEVRFSNGEGKVILSDPARGKDIFIICDVYNHSCTYNFYGKEHPMSPDEHFRDIKRAVTAVGGKAKRVNVMMPLLYSSRQDRNKAGRESLDCSLALQELERMGVKDIITFDVHNAYVQNAIPLMSFDNLYATYEIVKTFIQEEEDIIRNQDSVLIVSPDIGGMERAIYYSTVMNIDIGTFYKRRDYSKVVHGRNPIVDHRYLGQDVEGKHIIIIDDMISTGESILEVVRELKRRKADKIFIAATFALFTRGVSAFQELYDKGYLTKVYATNLAYIPEEFVGLPWFSHVDMSDYAARVIDLLNQNKSILPMVDMTKLLTEDIRRIRQ